ncbi:alpha/beta hydrolase [Rhodopseudomonas sp. NSM]|uniref:alpha/beta hydrolase n=1 Tax=Rhodopseudomonas sp. NSM TaxID=3457630 RepID=UPI00403730C5
MIAAPVGPPAGAAGYPVLYLLDGNAVFGTAAEIVGLRARRPDATGISPAVIVAIGYPTDLPLDLDRRACDYTPPVAVDDLPERPDGSQWGAVGGADAFLDFLLDTVRPLIARKIPVDPQRQALFGHSFGGLFALHALFTRPDAFTHYIAASPSIWWHRYLAQDYTAAFARRVRSIGVNASVLITIGELEQQMTMIEADAANAASRAQWKQHNRMVDNARELAAWLTALEGRGPLTKFVMFEGEDHGSVVPAALGRAVGFALGRPAR